MQFMEQKINLNH